MRLTEKDRDLIRLIERWGVMSVVDICRFQKQKYKRSVQWRLDRLVESGIIKREKSVFGFYVYMPSGFRGLAVASFEHDQTAKYLALYLSEKYECEYRTLRELRSAALLDEGTAGLNKKIPDFVLVKDGQCIAVEVELTAKDTPRLRKLISNYTEALIKKEFFQVNYFCGSQAILDRVLRVITEKGAGQWIKAVLLPDEVRQDE